MSVAVSSSKPLFLFPSFAIANSLLPNFPHASHPSFNSYVEVCLSVFRSKENCKTYLLHKQLRMTETHKISGYRLWPTLDHKNLFTKIRERKSPSSSYSFSRSNHPKCHWPNSQSPRLPCMASPLTTTISSQKLVDREVSSSSYSSSKKMGLSTFSSNLLDHFCTPNTRMWTNPPYWYASRISLNCSSKYSTLTHHLQDGSHMRREIVQML